jgi:nucleoside-diphosphate-sugar epimerase
LYFILGGNGFVGSSFTRFCKKTNTECIVIDKTNYDNYIGESCDVFINANGSSSKILAKNDPIKDFDATVRTTQKSIVDFKFKKYVMVSSCDVYPDCSSPDITKETLDINISKQSPYGFHKYLAEQCIMHGTNDWLILRLGGMIGPGLKKNPIFDIIHGGPLWVDPESKLQYLLTDDVARIAFELIKNNLKNEIFNVCGRGLVHLKVLLDNNLIKVNPNSPTITYDVNIEKISKITHIPDSVTSVMDFIQAYGR